MEIYLSRAGRQSGPYSFTQVRDIASNGRVTEDDLLWYEGCSEWIPARELPGIFQNQQRPFPPAMPCVHKPSNQADGHMIRKLSNYEQISGVLWICLGAVQILTLVGAIAGGWNLYAGITRLRTAKQIEARHPGIPAAFESMTGLIVIGVLNLLLGGVIGIVFVALDFYIREQVLSNAELFIGTRDAARTAA